MLRRKPARPRLWLGGAATVALAMFYAGCETDSGQTQSPKPAEPLGVAAPGSARDVIEKRLQAYAEAQAHDIANIYVHSPEKLYPGAKALGWQLLFEVLGKPWQPVNFETAVRRNPLFWQAAIELGPGDVSLPFLYASLAILGKDYASAERILTIAQATMPLTPTIRKIYATPESLLSYREQLLVPDIPSFEDIHTAGDCERYASQVRIRLILHPESIQLQSMLIELESKRAWLLAWSAPAGPALNLLDQRIMERLELTAELKQQMAVADPLFANAANATVRDWLNKSTLAQKWMRWSDYCEPADIKAVEESIAFYTAAGRGDLAWMVWRSKRNMNWIAADNDRMRWTAWSDQLLLPAEKTRLVEASRLPTAGSGMLPIAVEGPSEAWSGDRELHPLVAIKIERYLAMIDAMLQNVTRGSNEEGQLRASRAQQLSEVRAFVGAQRELDRASQILGAPEKILSLQAALLSDEGKFAEADKVFQRLLALKQRSLLTNFRYGFHLYRQNDFPAARAQFRALAGQAAWDSSMAIMADLAARRGGAREMELLSQSAAQVVPGSWDEAGLNFFLGKSTEAQLLEATRRDSEFETLQRQCEAYYWLSQVALGEGRKDDAEVWLQRCLSTGFAAHLEYWLARDELKRLAPEKVKERDPRDSEWNITT